jgi:hypothetical protein
MFLPEDGGGDRLEINMETTVIDRKGRSKIPVRRVKTVPRTANSACSPAVSARISGFRDNPVKYTDPDGREVFHGGKYPGWSEDAPQAGIPYKDWMDPASKALTFNIHGAKMEFDGGYLRLWKGDYNNLPFAMGKGGAGGEIGFYGYNDKMIKGEQLSQSIGLTGATMRLFAKNDNHLVAEYGELSGWVTAFNPEESISKENLYSVNTFEFRTERQAAGFANNIRSTLLSPNRGKNYGHNGNENISIQVQGNKAIVTWGLPE